MKIPCLLILIIFPAISGLNAQLLPEQEPLLPEDYDPSEFPLWVQDVGRFESITFGSFPVTFFAASFFYDLSLYAINNGQSQYALGTQRGENDIAIIIGAAAITSLIIATVDMIINISRRNQAKEDELRKIPGPDS